MMILQQQSNPADHSRFRDGTTMHGHDTCNMISDSGSLIRVKGMHAMPTMPRAFEAL